ncbi:MAG TPA: hypothetical protein VEI97_14670 [bacterium]|nr:hypothetical protein [bacterium]
MRLRETPRTAGRSIPVKIAEGFTIHMQPILPYEAKRMDEAVKVDAPEGETGDELSLCALFARRCLSCDFDAVPPATFATPGWHAYALALHAEMSEAALLNLAEVGRAITQAIGLDSGPLGL